MSEQLIESKERRTVTYTELLGIAVIILGAVLMFWKTTDVRLSALEIRMNGTEQVNKQVVDKLDKVQEGINDVKLTLKDKQDRKQ